MGATRPRARRRFGPFRLVVLTLLVVPPVLMVVLGVSGYFLFTRSHQDAVQPVDAIVVLGGEHDGREQYGLDLAEQGIADTVVMSNPYGPNDKTMARFCEAGTDRITVICFRPSPSTTAGEAMEVRDLAAQRGWTSVLVISWRYHLPRAKYIFGQCFDGTTIMRAVPRSYPFSLLDWEFVYLYQYGGFVRAFTGTGC